MSNWEPSSLSVGDHTLTVVPLGAIRDDPSLWFAERGPAQRVVELPTNCLHVAGPECSVLIDACDPGLYPISGGQFTDIRTALIDVGIDPDAVTHVILTHGHHDHFCGVWDLANDRPNFPNARHILSLRDWTGETLTEAAQKADGMAANAYPLEALDHLGLLDLDNPGTPLPNAITLIDAPGETAGHRIVQIEDHGEVVFFLADLVHVAEEVAAPELCPVWADEEVLRQTRQHVIHAIRAHRANSLCSHIRGAIEPEAWGRKSPCHSQGSFRVAGRFGTANC